jgi:lysophospholipase L1-like esterase
MRCKGCSFADRSGIGFAFALALAFAAAASFLFSTSAPADSPSQASNTGRQPTAASLLDGGSRGPASAVRFSHLRVLLLGDSMTAGDEDYPKSFRSYRGTLYKLLQAAGHDVDFVGPNHLPPAAGGDPDHAAFGGAEIGPGNNPNNVVDRLAPILSSVGDVDVIILALGWNSVFNEPAEAARKYEGLVDRLTAARPEATLALATLSPPRGQSEKEATFRSQGYRELNASARRMAERSPTDKLILADLAAARFDSSDFWDVIHWHQSGADTAAAVLFRTLTENAAIVTRGR